MDKPYGVPADFAEHFKLMSNMIAIAFQADLTRIVTFLVTREGSSRPYRELGIADGHHPLTHHRNQPDLMEKVRKINEYHVQQFAGFVEKMKSTKEGDRSLLDNCMIVYGAGLSDGNAHLHEDLPTLMRGPRRQLSSRPDAASLVRRETPMCNLFLTMMDRMGVHMDRFGDSTGRLQRAGSGVDPCHSAAAAKPPAGAFFDTDFSTIDSVLAVALLYGLAGQERLPRGHRHREPPESGRRRFRRCGGALLSWTGRQLRAACRRSAWSRRVRRARRRPRSSSPFRRRSRMGRRCTRTR